MEHISEILLFPLIVSILSNFISPFITKYTHKNIFNLALFKNEKKSKKILIYSIIIIFIALFLVLLWFMFRRKAISPIFLLIRNFYKLSNGNKFIVMTSLTAYLLTSVFAVIYIVALFRLLKKVNINAKRKIYFIKKMDYSNDVETYYITGEKNGIFCIQTDNDIENGTFKLVNINYFKNIKLLIK